MTTIGYFEEYIMNGKYIGSKKCDEQSDRGVGYKGRKDFVANEKITLDNGKKIKQGKSYYTRYYPLNGRIDGLR